MTELSFEPGLIGSKIHACKPLRHIMYFSLEELLFGDKFKNISGFPTEPWEKFYLCGKDHSTNKTHYFCGRISLETSLLCLFNN